MLAVKGYACCITVAELVGATVVGDVDGGGIRRKDEKKEQRKTHEFIALVPFLYYIYTAFKHTNVFSYFFYFFYFFLFHTNSLCQSRKKRDMTLAELFPFHRTEVRELVVGSVLVALQKVFLFVKVVDHAL